MYGNRCPEELFNKSVAPATPVRRSLHAVRLTRLAMFTSFTPQVRITAIGLEARVGLRKAGKNVELDTALQHILRDSGHLSLASSPSSAANKTQTARYGTRARKMHDIDIEKTRAELMNLYPGSLVVVAGDNCEIVSEISDGFAVAVIERSLPHFHLRMRETYRVLRGTLHVACGGRGFVLREGETITIEPGQIHFARAAGEPVWVEVESDPPWSADDHFIL